MIPKKILIIDDDDMNTELMIAILKMNGFDTISAQNGELGLKSLAANKPDAIVLDVRLPDIDGLSLCKKMKASQTIPIIIVSGFNEESLEASLKASGADGFVSRMQIMSQLPAQLKKLLENNDLNQ
ncbi:hypothetical protein MASR2M15_10820 [Anaerolineales bacterium]